MPFKYNVIISYLKHLTYSKFFVILDLIYSHIYLYTMNFLYNFIVRAIDNIEAIQKENSIVFKFVNVN